MTSNSFQFYEGTRSTTQAPQVTVRRSGQMVLTPAAVAMLGDDATHVQFGHDPDTQTVALRSAPNGAKGRYRLRSQANGSSLVDGRRFMAHYELRVDKARTFPAEVVGDGIVGFSIPKAETVAETESEDQTAGTKAGRTGKRKAAATA